MPKEITTPSINPQPQANSAKKLNLKKVLITVIVISIIVGSVGGAIFWYTWNTINQEDKVATVKQSSSSAKEATPSAKINILDWKTYKSEDTSNWKSYISTKTKIKFSYPTEFKVSESLLTLYLTDSRSKNPYNPTEKRVNEVIIKRSETKLIEIAYLGPYYNIYADGTLCSKQKIHLLDQEIDFVNGFAQVEAKNGASYFVRILDYPDPNSECGPSSTNKEDYDKLIPLMKSILESVKTI